MTSTHWEKVAAGRYASELHGRVLQAIRRDGPHDPGDRPYIAVVDRVPVGIGAWSLGQAKTQAIRHVERQHGKAKAERAWNGATRPADPPMIPDPEPVQPDPEPVQSPNEPVQVAAPPELGRCDGPALAHVPGQLAITGRLTDADLLNALNALRSTLEMLREHADLECTVNLPPVMKL